MRSFGHFVGGEWKDSYSGTTFERRSPANEKQVAGMFQAGNDKDVEAVVAAAKDVSPSWRATSPAQREAVFFRTAEIIEERQREIAESMAQEMGKPLNESVGEVTRAVQVLRYFAGEIRGIVGEVYASDLPESYVRTTRQPRGLVALITPWNFPIAIPAWKVAPALAYGNTVVAKPASDAPGATLLLAECFSQGGLPDGAFNVVTGGGSSVGSPVVRHSEIRAISFTGSAEVGDEIREEGGRWAKPVQLELGGQNPAVVLSDADLDQAAAGVVTGAMGATGQKCTATRRAIVQRGVYDEFRDKVLERLEDLVIGDPFDDRTDLGPLVNQAALDLFEQAIEKIQEQGGKIIAGGRRIELEDLDDGFFVEPTVAEEIMPGTLLACEEVFAPILGLMPADDYDEAIQLANSVRYGLSAAVFTRNIGAAERFIKDIDAGVVHVNSPTSGAEVHVPFGGIKASGFGPHEQGRAAIEFYTQVKTVYMTPSAT